MKDNTLFEILDQITNTKNPDYIKNLTEDKRKNINVFILNKWLSQDPSLLVFADILNKHTFFIPLEMYYKIAVKSIPKSRVFFKWIGKDKKGTKKEKGLQHDFLINILTNEYQISKREVKDYLDIFEKHIKLIIPIIKKYPIEDRDLKRIGFKRSDLFGEVIVKKEEKKVVVEKKKSIWEDLLE